MEIQSQSISEILCGRVNHANWVSMIKLYKNICVCGGIIFGGAVRDYVKRTLAAEKYEEFCNINKINFKTEYNNETVCPDTYKARQILPNDIDVFIHEKDYYKFISRIEEEYEIIKTDAENYFFKKADLFDNAIIFKKIYVKLINSSSNHLIDILLKGVKYDFNIKIDFVILKTEYKKHEESFNGGLLFPPFGNPDFDVNQLFMYNENKVSNDINIDILNICFKESLFNSFEYESSNFIDNSLIRLQPLKTHKLKNSKLLEIFENISSNIAIPFNPEYLNILKMRKYYGLDYNFTITYNRINKMIKKGYNINILKSLQNTSKINIYSPLSYKSSSHSDIHDIHDNKCIICFDELTEDIKCIDDNLSNIYIQYNECCNARYHFDCFIKYIENHQKSDKNYITCPHCRSEFKNECPCSITNFYIELLHYYKVIKKVIDCDCYYNYYSRCDKLITINCNCGIIDDYDE